MTYQAFPSWVQDWAARETQATTLAPGTELLAVGVGDAEQFTDHQDRQRQGECLVQVRG